MDVPANVSRCICGECSEAGCVLDVSDILSQVHLLSVNCLRRVLKTKGEIGDYAILWKNVTCIAAIEMKYLNKRKKVDISKVVDQVQGTLNLLENLTNGQSISAFYPIVIYHGKRNPVAALKQRKVRFRGQSRSILTGACGRKLTSILASTRRNRSRRNRPGSRR